MGNAADQTGIGAVSYEYFVGTYEVDRSLPGNATLRPTGPSGLDNLFSPAAALSTDVKFNHSFNALDADFASVDGTGTLALGSPVITGGALDLTNSTTSFEVRGTEVTRGTLTPEPIGLARSPSDAIDGGTAEENAAIMRAVWWSSRVIGRW